MTFCTSALKTYLLFVCNVDLFLCRENDKAIIQQCQRTGVSKETFSTLAKQLNKLPNEVRAFCCSFIPYGNVLMG